MMTTDNSMDVMEALLDKDADINATNSRGRSVVNQAILLGQFKKAIKLIEKNAKITKEEVDEIRKVRPGQLDSINAVISARNAERSGGRRRKTRRRKTRKNRKYSHKKN